MTLTLAEICETHEGKISDKWTGYIDYYEQRFAALRDREIRFLEIGVLNGGSLEIWAKFFHNASRIDGCDLAPKTAELTFEDPRIRAIVRDAGAPGLGAALGEISRPFDVVIDDGSHHAGLVVRSFMEMLPHLSERAIYIVEDMHCSYYPNYGGGLYAATSPVSFFKRLADVVNRAHWDLPLTPEDLLGPALDEHGAVRSGLEHLSRIRSVTFADSIIDVQFAPKNSVGLGTRRIFGRQEPVTSGAAQHDQTPYDRAAFCPVPIPEAAPPLPELRAPVLPNDLRLSGAPPSSDPVRRGWLSRIFVSGRR